MAFTADTISCVAGVAGNLLHPPNMSLTRNENLVDSDSGKMLNHTLRPEQNSGIFKCSVCIEIEEAEIANHCSHDTLTLSDMGECVVCYFHSALSLSLSLSLSLTHTHCSARDIWFRGD